MCTIIFFKVEGRSLLFLSAFLVEVWRSLSFKLFKPNDFPNQIFRDDLF